MENWRSTLRVESVVSFASILVLVGAMAFASDPARGWIGMLGFVGIGAVLLFGRSPMPPYARISGAVLFVMMAASFGFPIVWIERAAWFDDARRVVMLLAALGYGRYTWSLRTLPATVR